MLNFILGALFGLAISAAVSFAQLYEPWSPQDHDLRLSPDQQLQLYNYQQQLNRMPHGALVPVIPPC